MRRIARSDRPLPDPVQNGGDEPPVHAAPAHRAAVIGWHAPSRGFQGATRHSSAIPGNARSTQSQKKPNQPSRSTSQPVMALTKVRGTAARLVNRANWVAV